MSTIQIDNAVAADVRVILEMIRGLADYEKLSHLVTATEDQVCRTLFGDRPAAEVLLARRDGECIGFALFFQTYSTFRAQPGMYLEDLYVKPHARGQGAGLALFIAMAKLAVARNYGRVEWAVLNWNEPAIGFYQKLGAIPLDEWTSYRLTGDPLLALADRTP